MKKRSRKAVLLVLLALALGASAAVAQGGNWSYTGADPPKLPPAVARKGPKPPLPAEAQEQLARIRETERRTGRTPAMPKWNEATNDFERNPDGSVRMVDTNPSEPPPPPCMSTAKGCGREYNPPPAAFCANLPKGCDER